MVTTILTHEVKDFSEWKKGFDGDVANRDAMGVNISGVYRAAENPNMVTVIGTVPSLEAVQAFMSNPELKATMEKAGVIGAPEMKVLHSAN
jgi:hypothetical protein